MLVTITADYSSYRLSMFVDEVDIHVTAGDGGRGCLAFRREKFVPRGGPSGGDGGHGGSVYVVASPHTNTLINYRFHPEASAGRGEHGMGSNCTGQTGEDRELPVPIGTLVYEKTATRTARFSLLADLAKEGDRVLVARGGRGGMGNARFASSTNRAPRKVQPGEPGEEKDLRLELKLLADVGLVGFPNAGKSTLIARVSAARPKIADYPFTTLTPNLGVVKLSGDRSFAVADVPGLIEGAHRGLGLGHQFLRHLERTKVLVHVVDVSGSRGPRSRRGSRYRPTGAAAVPAGAGGQAADRRREQDGRRDGRDGGRRGGACRPRSLARAAVPPRLGGHRRGDARAARSDVAARRGRTRVRSTRRRVPRRHEHPAHRHSRRHVRSDSLGSSGGGIRRGGRAEPHARHGGAGEPAAAPAAAPRLELPPFRDGRARGQRESRMARVGPRAARRIAVVHVGDARQISRARLQGLRAVLHPRLRCLRRHRELDELPGDPRSAPTSSWCPVRGTPSTTCPTACRSWPSGWCARRSTPSATSTR